MSPTATALILASMAAMGTAAWILHYHIRRGAPRFRRVYLLLQGISVGAMLAFLVVFMRDLGVLAQFPPAQAALLVIIILAALLLNAAIHYRYISGKTRGALPLLGAALTMAVGFYAMTYLVLANFATLGCFRIIAAVSVGSSAPFGMRASRKVARTGDLRWWKSARRPGA